MRKKCLKMKLSEKKDKEAKTTKRKRIKWNAGTICKETKKNIKVCLSVFQFISSEVKRSKNVYFVSFQSETKRKNVYFVSLRSEMKKSEAKQKFLEAKQSKTTVYWFCFCWKRKIRSEKKLKKNFLRVHAKRISFRFVSIPTGEQGGCPNFLKRQCQEISPIYV
jgi:hypothetical protein